MKEEHPDPAEQSRDAEDCYRFGYQKGGVPGWLVLVYAGFLSFSLWYVVQFFAPSFLRDHPADGPAPLDQHAEP